MEVTKRQMVEVLTRHLTPTSNRTNLARASFTLVTGPLADSINSVNLATGHRSLWYSSELVELIFDQLEARTHINCGLTLGNSGLKLTRLSLVETLDEIRESFFSEHPNHI